MRRNELLFEALDQLQVMRSDGREALDAFIGRIYTRLVEHRPAVPQDMPVATCDRAPVHTPSIRAVLQSLVLLLPVLREQRRRRARSRRVNARTPFSIVTISATRLAAVSEGRSIRETLVALVKPMPESQDPNVAAKFERPRELLLCDPAASSRLWANIESCWNDDAYVIDITYLIFALCASPLTALRAALKVVWIATRALLGQSRGRTAFVECVIATVLAESYQLVLEQEAELDGIFLTSNSFATEILRFVLLRDGRCSSLTEVLHGVPTKPYEHYVAQLWRLGGSRNPSRVHQVVVQIPDLRVRGELFPAPGAVNCYINQYATRFGGSSAHLESYIEGAREALLSDISTRDDSLIVCFVGGMADDLDYMASKTFACERALLAIMKHTLDQGGRAHVICYTPHPLNPMARFRQVEPFASGQVKLYSDTVAGHLLADCSVGLLSSGLFEARHSGARVYTPLDEADDVFESALLDLLEHPADRTVDFVGDLTTFLVSNHASPTREIVARAQRRAARLWRLGGQESLAEPIAVAR